MKLVRWTRFTWDLSKLPSYVPTADPHYRVRPATSEDEQAVRRVIFSAFSLDSDWNDTLKTLHHRIETELNETFSDGKEIPCLVVTHGARVIGASALRYDIDAENHFLSGPCILTEYRNRGLGTMLLHQSLSVLRDHGLMHVHGITKGNVPAAKFLYTKFGSTSDAYDFEPQLVHM